MTPPQATFTYLRQAPAAMLALLVAFALVLGVKTWQQIGHDRGHTPPDFLGFYYGAKLLGHANIYDRPAFCQAVLADPEYREIPPLDAVVHEIYPAPQPIYPPFAFLLLKPYTWLGFGRAFALHGLSTFLATLVTALSVGSIVARLFGNRWGLLGAVAVLAYYSVEHEYALNLSLGQVNMHVAAGLTAAVALAPTRPRLSFGLLLAVLLFKPSGLLVALPFLWQMRRVYAKLWPAVAIAAALCLLAGPAAWVDFIQATLFGSLKHWLAAQVNLVGSGNVSVEAIALGAGGNPAQQTLIRYGLSFLYLGLLAVILWAFTQKRTSFAAAAAAGVICSFLLGPISWMVHILFLAPFLFVGTLVAGLDASRSRSLRPEFAVALAALVLILLASHVRGPLSGALGRINVLLALPYHTLAAAVLMIQALAAGQSRPVPEQAPISLPGA